MIWLHSPERFTDIYATGVEKYKVSNLQELFALEQDVIPKLQVIIAKKREEDAKKKQYIRPTNPEISTINKTNTDEPEASKAFKSSFKSEFKSCNEIYQIRN